MDSTFDFIGDVSDTNMIALRNFIVSLNKDITEITINISSLGGNTYSGITIYNYLKTLPLQVHTHNLGEVSSAAILLYLAGSTRTAENICKFIIHPIFMGVNGTLPYCQIQELLTNLESDIQNYAQIVNKETDSMKGKYNVEKCLKTDALSLNKTKALECGIINM